MTALDDGPASNAHVHSCSTCGDMAVPLTVVALAGTGDADCRGKDGVIQRVATDLVGPITVGDVVLVHAGVAMVRLGATRSRRRWRWAL